MKSEHESSGPDPTLDFVSHSVAQTRRVGIRLAELLRPGDVVLLEGPLGGGKTMLTQGIAEGLGISGDVASPSFTLINEYRPKDTGVRCPLYHMDLYRLADVEKEAVSMGMEEYLQGDGVCVVEWADRAMSLMPAEHLHIRFTIVSDTKRGVCMMPRGERYRELVREFKKKAFGI